jgi:small subunit ribosomal protein S6
MSETLGKLREYETVFVTGAEMTEEAIKELFGRFREVVEKNEGSILREDSWGKRKFAYDVNRASRGAYLVLHYAAPASAVSHVERSLRNSDKVMRFMTSRLGEVEDVEARRADIEKVVREKAARKKQEEEEAAAAAAAQAEREGGASEARGSES